MVYTVDGSEMVDYHVPDGTLNGQAYTQTQLPEENPHWDLIMTRLPVKQMIPGGTVRGHEGRREKAMNLSKTSAVLQEPDESPAVS
jgi:hypothetical protein